MNHQNYLKRLHEIADKMHEIGQPLTDAQSVGIAKILAQDLEGLSESVARMVKGGADVNTEVLAILQARNAVADKIEMREDALHRGYKVAAPMRKDYTSQAAYDRAYDAWSMRKP